MVRPFASRSSREAGADRARCASPKEKFLKPMMDEIASTIASRRLNCIRMTRLQHNRKNCTCVSGSLYKHCIRQNKSAGDN